MTSAYYTQTANGILPIFGVSSMDEAKQFVAPEDHGHIIESEEDVYMNLATGSVDFASGWDNLDDVVMVRYSSEEERWVEA